MKVIAISGWKRSGKDTIANHLVDKHGFKRVGFADPLKDMVAEEYDIPRVHCDDPEFKESPIMKYPVTPRDSFAKDIADIMFLELRNKEGKRSRYDNFVSSQLHNEQLYWTPRALCILKGSTNRSVVSNYWVTCAVNKIGFDQSHKEKTYVISDLRYKNEVEQLRSFFGANLTTVRVNRFDSSPSVDPSERDLDNGQFDVVISNKGTLEELLAKAEALL